MEGRGKDAQAYKHTSTSFKCSYETLREVGGHGPASASASAGAVYPMAICKSTWQHRQRCPEYCVFIYEGLMYGWMEEGVCSACESQEMIFEAV